VGIAVPAAASGESARPQPLAIELDRPVSDAQVRGPAARVEVSGRAGTFPFYASDVVLLVDHSTLGAIASGSDVDDDGVVGRTRSSVKYFDPLAPNAPLWTTDSGDTVQEMQLRIARDLVWRLAERENRVGLMSFSYRARTYGGALTRLIERPGVVVPVGAPDPVLAALSDFPPPQQYRWTNLERLLERGVELLDDAALDGEPARPRVILLLSHGAPAAPAGVGWSTGEAVESAEGLAARGIEIWAVPLRGTGTGFLSDLTRGSGGEVVPLHRLDAQFGAPFPVDLQPRELEIENLTSRRKAADVRIFSDGRFDAVVPLEPGVNTVEIRAVLADGHRTTLRRAVHYEGPEAQ
jgi:hypothetical protein